MFNRIFLRGDTHGDFSWLKDWCKNENTTEKDAIIILGDAGINFWLKRGSSDTSNKRKIAAQPITVLCIQGNHEKRPEPFMGYELVYKREIGGFVWVEEKYPNIWFLINGIYVINGKKFLIADGAYSIDKEYRLTRGVPWFKDEQMSDEDMEKLFKICEHEKYFHYVLSHTAPMNYEPTYLFLPFIDQSRVDKHTEWILQQIYDKIDFGHWYFAHYHDTNLNYQPKMSLLYKEIIQIM